MSTKGKHLRGHQHEINVNDRIWNLTKNISIVNFFTTSLSWSSTLKNADEEALIAQPTLTDQTLTKPDLKDLKDDHLDNQFWQNNNDVNNVDNVDTVDNVDNADNVAGSRGGLERLPLL